MSDHVLSQAEAAAIEETIQSFSRCLEAKDYISWVSYWADDGVLMPPGHPRVVGHAALVDYVREEFGNVQFIELSDWQIYGDGGLAVATTNVELTTADAEPTAPMKQVIVLGRDTSGKWRLNTVIFNAGA